MSDLPLYIFDLDGTLSLTHHRQHLIEGAKQEWDKFFEECDKDAPNLPVIRLMQHLNVRGEVLIFSGRSDLVREKTLKWLEYYTELPRDLLPRMKMRRQGDYTADEVLKRDWYQKYLTNIERTRLVCIFDDRDKVVEMWRSLGLTCMQVADGNF